MAERGDRGVHWLGLGTCCTECTDRYHAAGFGFVADETNEDDGDRVVYHEGDAVIEFTGPDWAVSHKGRYD